MRQAALLPNIAVARCKARIVSAMSLRMPSPMRSATIETSSRRVLMDVVCDPDRLAGHRGTVTAFHDEDSIMMTGQERV